jgi:hypothetical protein
MKNQILLSLAILLTACGASDDGTDPINNNSNFSISLAANSQVGVDEIIAINITGNENIFTLEGSLDNFATTIFNQTRSVGFGTNTTVYFNFDELGSESISIKAKNNNGDESIQTIDVSVVRGNAIKITGVQVLSFFNIDGTWDLEFPEDDINRLADVFFNLRKPTVEIFNGNLLFVNWFKSDMKENQGDLTWDLSTEDLYINPQRSLLFGLADDDGTFVEDLLMGPPFERELTLSEHIANQPNIITLSVPEIELEVAFTVEWN